MIQRARPIVNMFHVKHLSQLLVLLLVVLTAAGCTLSRNPVTGEKRPYGYSWEQEIQLGAEADQQIVQQYGLYDEEEVQAYVERIGEQVLQYSHLKRAGAPAEFRNTEFTFRVLDSPVVNAFALPGGYVYVTRGLLAHLQNEAQLAVVLGHEIGHVAGRHASERAFEQQLGQLGVIGGAILGQQVLGLPGQEILNLGSAVQTLLTLKYGREDEREADRLGVEYAAQAGYDASEAAGFFHSLGRLGDRQGGGLPSWLSTHPDPGEREQNIVQYAAKWETEYAMDEVDQETYYDVIDNIVVGEDPRQGYVQNGVFYHPTLRFQFPVPAGFLVINQPTQVAMVPENQQAALVFSVADATSAQQAGASFAGQQGLQVVDRGATQVNGRSAYYVLADAQTESGVVRVLAYFIEYNGEVYSFLGYAGTQAFGSYQDAFLRTIRGFTAVQDPRILDVQPLRLNIATASRLAPFRAYIEGDLPRDWTAENVAILNQVLLNEEIQPGSRLKLIRP